MGNPFSVITDKKKNRLLIDLNDIDIESLDKIIEDIWDNALKLKAGWGCIVNYGKVDIPLTLEVREKIGTFMSFLKPLGMGQIVRVFREDQPSFQEELKKLSIEIGGYEGIDARTVQDANTVLDLIR